MSGNTRVYTEHGNMKQATNKGGSAIARPLASVKLNIEWHEDGNSCLQHNAVGELISIIKTLPLTESGKDKAFPSRLGLIFHRETVKMAVTRLYHMNKELAQTLYGLTKTMAVLDLKKNEALPSKLSVVFRRESVKMAVSRLHDMNKELAQTFYGLTKTMTASDLKKNEALPSKLSVIFPTESTVRAHGKNKMV